MARGLEMIHAQTEQLSGRQNQLLPDINSGRGGDRRKTILSKKTHESELNDHDTVNKAASMITATFGRPSDRAKKGEDR